MWFRRIEEIHEVDLPHHTPGNTHFHFEGYSESSSGVVQYGPKPLGRILEDVEGEDGDYSRFKRIRVISKTKRVKAPKIFIEAQETCAFHTPGENGNNTPELSKMNDSENAVDVGLGVAGETSYFHGLVEEDTHELARSRYKSADDDRHKRPSTSSRRSFNIPLPTPSSYIGSGTRHSFDFKPYGEGDVSLCLDFEQNITEEGLLALLSRYTRRS
jgi:hypothetical protein